MRTNIRAEGAMTHGERPEGLEIEQDPDFQRRDWKRERWGWAVMTALVAAALLGLFGTGPLSSRVAGEVGGPLWVEYDKYSRWRAPEQVRVHLGPGSIRDGRARIWLSRSFVERHDIERVTPPPAAVEVHDDRYVYVFSAPTPAADMAITFALRPESWGFARGVIGVDGGPAAQIEEIVYP
jgi:hypothetical protein